MSDCVDAGVNVEGNREEEEEEGILGREGRGGVLCGDD